MPPPMSATSTGLPGTVTTPVYGGDCTHLPGAGPSAVLLEFGVHPAGNFGVSGIVRMQPVGRHPLRVALDPARGTGDIVGADVGRRGLHPPADHSDRLRPLIRVPEGFDDDESGVRKSPLQPGEVDPDLAADLRGGSVVGEVVIETHGDENDVRTRGDNLRWLVYRRRAVVDEAETVDARIDLAPVALGADHCGPALAHGARARAESVGIAVKGDDRAGRGRAGRGSLPPIDAHRDGERDRHDGNESRSGDHDGASHADGSARRPQALGGWGACAGWGLGVLGGLGGWSG